MTVFKSLSADDKVSTKTLLHEAIPITGTILSGTYGEHGSEGNIQNFTHGMFQSVHDYPYLSSSANHIFDITFGTSDTSLLAVTNQAAKKDNIYNQMAQVLMGYNKDGGIQKFDSDGDLASGGTKINEAIFLSFSRLLVKDEIKKGSFELELGVSGAYNKSKEFDKRIKIVDQDAATSYKVNSPAGEYGILYATQSAAPASRDLLDITQHTHTASLSDSNTYWRAGLIFYQAGIVVLTSSVLCTTGAAGGFGFLTDVDDFVSDNSRLQFESDGTTLTGSLIAQSISASADELRHRIYNIQFNNTIELNSTVYFCRAKHNEFNYSSNPTYLTGSQIRVKNETTDIPISYITSVGLYSADNQLIAVGKFSEPIRKDNNIELTFRARLDY
jgi:hypothetical protein